MRSDRSPLRSKRLQNKNQPRSTVGTRTAIGASGKGTKEPKGTMPDDTIQNQNSRRIRVTTFTNQHSAHPDNVAEWSWEEFCASLLEADHIRTNDKEADDVGLFD